MTTIIDLATNLARSRGWHVFPVREDKRPACPRGFRVATEDPDAITKLWQQYPGPLIGIATGAVSGFDALDLDLKHDAALGWWHVNRTRVPPTRTYRTRSGGAHLYFDHAPGLGCSAGKLAEGVDVRADGGYVVGWFAAGLECLNHTPAVAWPAYLLADLLPKPTPKLPSRRLIRDHCDREVDGVLRSVATAPDGQRNRILHWAACRLGERAAAGLIGPGEAEALLVAAAATAGLAEAEARSTARSGLGRSR